MNKLVVKKNIKKYFAWKIIEITQASILIGTALSFFWLKILISPMQITLDYLFYIFIAMVFNLYKSVIINVVLDTLLLLLRGSIGTWWWSFAIIPIIISLIVRIFMYLIFNKRGKAWLINVFFINIFTTFFAMTIIIINHIYTTKYRNISDYIIWSFISLLIIINVIIFELYFWKKTQKLKNIISIWSLVSLLLVVLLWVYGPINFFYWFKHLGNYNNISLKDKYFYLLFPRMIKSLVEIPLFSIILYSFYTIDMKWKNSSRS